MINISVVVVVRRITATEWFDRSPDRFFSRGDGARVEEGWKYVKRRRQKYNIYF